MRRLDLMPNKKLRGGKRYLKQFQNYLEILENSTPQKYEGYDYWNDKIVIYEKLLNSEQYIQEIFNAYIKSAKIFFDKNKKKDSIFTVILSNPNRFSSEICVFYTKEYFEDFCKRNNEYQTWIPVEKGIIDELKLNVPKNCEVLNFQENIKDEDYSYDGTVTILKFL
jgi:hypothetical protein